MTRILALAVVLASSGGCYLKPTSTSDALQARGAVRISLVGQDCEDHRSERGDPIARDLGVRVRVSNPTDAPLRIVESAVRLRVDDYAAAVRDPAIVDVPARSAKMVDLAFLHHALCEPERQFAIAWNDGIILADTAISVSNLTFHP